MLPLLSRDVCTRGALRRGASDARTSERTPKWMQCYRRWWLHLLTIFHLQLHFLLPAALALASRAFLRLRLCRLEDDMPFEG